MVDAADTSETLPGERNYATDEAVDRSGDLPGSREKRCRVGDHSACAAYKKVAKEHAQWRSPDLKARWDVTHVSPAEWADAALSARTAWESSRVSGQG